jgi:16S rRNA (adenine1518-N6/adenine1519-N6)-dimethyltransferase
MANRLLAKKRFGQNFLIDLHYVNRLIASVELKKNDHIIEIGPGKGALTQYILPAVERYDAIEIDRDLVPILEKKFAHYPSFHLHCADALKFNFTKLHHKKPMRFIGNLPYNISSPLLFYLLLHTNTLTQDMHFMLQREVAERITAKAHTSQYGRLSVMTQYFCFVELLFSVPKEAFKPRPKVFSAFCRFIPKPLEMLTAKNHDVFANIVKEAFTYRRKVLANSLKKYVDSDTLRSLGINPIRRAETLSVDEFVKISNAIS